MFLDKSKYTTSWSPKNKRVPVEVTLYEPRCVTCKNRWNQSVCRFSIHGKSTGDRNTIESCNCYSFKEWTEYECEFAKADRKEQSSNETTVRRSLMDELFDDNEENEQL